MCLLADLACLTNSLYRVDTTFWTVAFIARIDIVHVVVLLANGVRLGTCSN